MSKLYWGVVEDRKDPLYLGRCKVRVVGMHTNNRTLLPTEDLPWATPLQPITSAANSGIGHAPVGPVEGSWVAVQFLDEECQFPVMIGTVAGIPGITTSLADAEQFDVPDDEPSALPSNVMRTEDGTPITDSSGNPVVSGGDPSAGYLGRITQSQYAAMKAKIAMIESSNNPKSDTNKLGYIGTYQFGAAALEDLGYIKKGAFAKTGSNKKTFDDDANWTGKGGITSKESFLNNAAEQEIAMDAYLRVNYKRIGSSRVRVAEVPGPKMAGLLGMAHNQGSGSVSKTLNGVVGSDANGMSTISYYKKVYSALAAGEPQNPTWGNIYDDPTPSETTPTPPGQSKFDVSHDPVVQAKSAAKSNKTTVGFVDPNGVYPRADFRGEPDTSRLARNQRINSTIVGLREQQQVSSIAVANTNTTWREPAPAYNAKYPYNHVFESESGHTVEFDDTPGSERIAQAHMSGTYYEIDNLGNHNSRVKGNRVVIVDKDELVFIQGSGHVCINGDLSVKVNNTCQIEIAGDANVNVKGDTLLKCEGNLDQYIKGDMTTEVDGKYNLNVHGEVNVSSDGEVKTLSKARISFQTKEQVCVDGFQIHLNSGRSSTATVVPFTDQTFSPTIIQPQPISRTEAAAAEMEGTKKAADKAAEAPQVPTETTKTDDTPPAPASTVSTTCDFTEVTAGMQLSKNFTLQKLIGKNTFPYKVGQHDISDLQLACNMKKLCLNVIEPIFEQFSQYQPFITSCFRAKGNNVSRSGTISQHEKGQAVDLAFLANGRDRQKYFEVAQKILQSGIPFDQFLLEFRDPESVWIHISYSDYNRGQVLTLNNDRTVGQGLKLISRK